MKIIFNEKFQGFVHRGYSNNYLENSLESFEAAVKLGYRFIETDLRCTLDDEIVTFHDKDLKRILNIDIKIKDLTLIEIRKLLEKKGYIPTLIEILSKFPDIFFNIDLKEQSTLERSMEIVNKMNAFHRVCFASFNSSRIKEVYDNFPEAITSMGISDVIKFKLFYLNATHSNVLQIPIKWKGIKVFSKSLLKRAHNNSLKVHLWTINDESLMNELIELGVDGIMTDEAEILMKVMKQKGLA